MSLKSLKSYCINNYYSNVEDFSVNSTIVPNLKNLNILHFNIRGMNNIQKFDSLLLFIERLRTDVHLICITETMVNSLNIYSFNISNYTSIFSCRKDRSGGGIAMYIRNDLFYRIVSIDDGMLPFQYICIQLDGFKSTRVCCFYRPPSSDTKQFIEFCDEMLNKYKLTSDFVIVGDINIPINKKSHLVSDYESCLLSHGMVATNNYTTRPASDNILDHTISSFLNIERVMNSTIEADISDHSFVFSTLLFKPKYTCKLLEKKIIDYRKVNQLFENFLSSSTFDLQNPDCTLKLITEKYNELLDNFTTIKQRQMNLKNSSNCPWMSYDLWELIKDKNRILKRLKRYPGSAQLRNRLELLNKKIKSEKYYAKKRYFENLYNNLSQKEIWKQINNFMKNDVYSYSYSIMHNDVEYKDTNIIVEIFNRFFVDAGNVTPGNLAGGNDGNVNKLRTIRSVPNSCFLSLTTASEVYSIISSLDNTKGCGYDRISNSILKRNAEFFSELLSTLFNVVIESGIYPNCLKIARVIPIFKAGDRKLINNYRPISILSVFDKILEKIIASRMTEFLNSFNFFYHYQYGFRQGSGTDLALIEITDLIYRAFDNQKYVCGLFLDLRKAFDSIDHNLLLNKLYMYGFRGKSYNLMASYLTNRKQFVEIDGKQSSLININVGVPQGSVLGPLLFLIFINDIAQLPTVGQIRMFADDTAIFYEFNDHEHMLVGLKNDLNMLIEFFDVNKISLNLSKTKIMNFHSPYLPHCEFPALQFSNVTIECVDKYKYLGLIFDKHLCWEEHINSVCLKVCPFLFLIRKLSSFVPTYVLKLIYFSFIHSRFYYAIAVFGNASKNRLKNLQTLQNKCCKSVYKLPLLYPTTALYRDVAQGILPIEALCKLQLCVYMYKCLNMPSALSNMEYKYANHRYDTRSSNLLTCQNIRTEFGRKSISFIGPYVYNKLPNLIKDADNIFKFKKLVKAHLRSSVMNYV